MLRSREKGFLGALQKARQDLQKLDPYTVSFKAACDFRPNDGGGRFLIRFFGQDYVVQLPELSVRTDDGQEPDIATRLIILHYLIHADGAPPADHWIAFRELPNGRVYDSAFQGRSSLRLVRAYGMDEKGFVAAAQALGGDRLTFGDASFMFRLLPRVSMAVIVRFGDEEFGPNVTVLFDAAAGHYLPIEDLAVLGGVLASRLIKAGYV